MKKIYFIRHGESEGNVGPIRQAEDSSLTDRGRKQAEYVAERVSGLPIDIIISSTFRRAQETAEVISKKISVKVEYSSFFVERRRPSEQLNKPKDDPVALESERLIKESFLIKNYRYSDEENFDDLKERAHKALDFLTQMPEENILVTTHGFFMRIIMAYVVFGSNLTARDCEQFIRTFHMENTGVTVLGYSEKQKNPWWVWTWNDHAHLAELKN